MRSFTRRAALLTSLCILSGALIASAQTAAPPAASPQGFAAACDQALRLADQGAYARAKEALDPFVTPNLKGDDMARAKRLLERIDAGLEKQYGEEQRARTRAQATAADRAAAEQARRQDQQKRLAEADRLVKEGMSGDPELIRRAADLRKAVAAERAAAAYDSALLLFNQGQYDAAGAVLARIAAFLQQEAAKDALARVSLGAQREAEVQRMTAAIPDLKKNQVAYAAVLKIKEEEKRVAAEKARKVAEADALYASGMALFEKGDLDAAGVELKKVLDTQLSLGEAKDAKLAATMKTILDKQTERREARNTAAAAMRDTDEYLKKGNWRAAQDTWAQAVAMRKHLAPEEAGRLTALEKEIARLREQDTASLAKARAEAAATDAEAKAAQEYMDAVRQRHAILVEQRKAQAAEHLRNAEEAYKQLRYDDALAEAQKVLSYEPENVRALQLREEITAQKENRAPGALSWAPTVAATNQAKMDALRYDLDRHMKEAQIASSRGDYDRAIEHYEIALQTVAYLKRYGPEEGAEARIATALEQTRAAKKRSDDERLAQQRREANLAAEQSARAQREQSESQKMALIKEGFALYSRGQYQETLKTCERILDLDPENTAALDLRDKALEARKERTWGSVYDAQARNWDDERLRLKERLTWPAAHVQYPAREVWEEINGRGGVQLPSARAVKTPKELALENVLDTELESLSYSETPLPDVIAFLKGLLKEQVDFMIDPAVTQEDVLITVNLNKVTLRRALRAMLRPNNLNFIISSNGYIFISTDDGCMREEAQPWNLSLRQYNIQDLLIDITQSAGGGNSSSSSGNSSSSSSSSSNSSSGNGDDDSGGGGADAQSIMEFIIIFTGGPRTWDVAASLSSSSGNSGNDSSSSGSSGSRSILGGGGSGGGGGALGTGGGGGEGGLGEAMSGIAGEGPGRIMIERQGWLMVNHVDRIHKRIEEILAELRAQTTVMVSVEARLITVTDNFYKEFSLQFSQTNPNNSSGWNFSTGNMTSSGDQRLWDISAANWVMNLVPTTHVSPVGGLGNGIFSLTGTFMGDKQRQIFLRAVKDSEFSTVVSAPHVMCLNTQEQEISLTRQGTYVSGYNVSDGIAIPTIEQYTITETDLTVRPVVSADRRYVTMSVEPSIRTAEVIPTQVTIPIRASAGNSGDVSGAVQVTIGTLIEEDQQIASTCKVPDRGTIVLGGLATASERSGEGTVPILSHIPILKRLFINSAMAKGRTHLIFMVTPTILIEDELEP